MAYPCLTNFLNERNPLNRVSTAFWFALLGILGSATLIVTGRPQWLPVWFGLVSIYTWWIFQRHRAAERRKKLISRLDQQRWLDDLTGFAYRGNLTSRVPPRLGEHLENCAEVRESICRELHSGEWRSLCRQPEWTRVRDEVTSAADHMLVQALWLARPFIRKRGEWKARHRDRAEGERAEAARLQLEHMESRLQALLDEVAGEPFAVIGRPDPVEAAIAELSALRKAVDEVVELGR